MALALAGSLPSAAATLTVTNTSDSGPGSLRNAIQTANPGDTIQFNLPNPSTITLTSGPLIINTSLTITGPGATQLAVNGNHNSTVFSMSLGSTVTISGLTIQNGTAVDGGGIANFATLTVLNSTLSGNSASFFGGGIYNTGMLTVMNSTLSGNSATDASGGGGGIENTFDNKLTVTNSTLSGNSAVLQGGGIDNSGTITIVNSTLTGNSASSGGGITSFNDRPFDIKGTLLAKNGSGGNCYINSTVTSLGYNISDDGTCSFSGTGDENSVVTGAGLTPKAYRITVALHKPSLFCPPAQPWIIFPSPTAPTPITIG